MGVPQPCIPLLAHGQGCLPAALSCACAITMWSIHSNLQSNIWWGFFPPQNIWLLGQLADRSCQPRADTHSWFTAPWQTGAGDRAGVCREEQGGSATLLSQSLGSPSSQQRGCTFPSCLGSSSELGQLQRSGSIPGSPCSVKNLPEPQHLCEPIPNASGLRYC